PAHDLIELFIAPDRLDQPALAGQRFELALVIGLEPGGLGFEERKVGCEFGRGDAGIKIGQIPFGKLAELVVGRLRGGRGHGYSAWFDLARTLSGRPAAAKARALLKALLKDR